MATLEEASQCPKCKLTGKLAFERHRGREGKMLTFRCENNGCKWYDTTWVVQVRADGSIPDPDTRPRFKDFPEQVGGLEIARSMDYVSRLLEAQTKPGGAEV